MLDLIQGTFSSHSALTIVHCYTIFGIRCLSRTYDMFENQGSSNSVNRFCNFVRNWLMQM
jgi:hypothetical protein